MEFLKLLLRIIFEMIVEKVVIKLYNTTFLNERSPLYHKKLMEHLKAIVYTIKIWIVLVLYSFLQNIGLIKPLPKDSQTKIFFIILIALILAVFVVHKVNNNRRKLTV
jgi:hypothetical protein